MSLKNKLKELSYTDKIVVDYIKSLKFKQTWTKAVFHIEISDSTNSDTAKEEIEEMSSREWTTEQSEDAYKVNIGDEGGMSRDVVVVRECLRDEILNMTDKR
jgi:hypothetical protein